MVQPHTVPPAPTGIIVGVDTHKYAHVAVAIDTLGTRLGTYSVSADRGGYAELLAWARTLGVVQAFGIEGTGSYGVGLASFMRRHAVRVVEVSHCDRRKRRNHGKSDTLDAETAARSVLTGVATAVPKSADGAAEMVRQIKVARDTAVKARSAAIIALKTLIVNAPGELREALQPLTDRKLIDRCAGLRSGPLGDTTATTKHALRALAARWLVLASEIDGHDEALDIITQAAAPTLRDAFGIGVDSARRDDDCRGRPSHAPSVRGRLREAVWGLSRPHLERRNAPPSPLPRWPSAGRCRAVSALRSSGCAGMNRR